MANGKPLPKIKDKPRQMSLKRLKTLVWEEISRYVRQRDKGKCVTCGKADEWQRMDCGHYRHNTERNQLLGGNELWYDFRNLNCQCWGCNRMKSGRLDIYALYLQRKYGYGILEELNRLYLKPKKFSREELTALIKVTKEMIKNL